MKIIVEVERVYGNVLIYPIDKNAKTFCKLLNQKTLTGRNLEYIEDLGYKIEVETQEKLITISSQSIKVG